MKRIFTLLVLTIVFFSSCKKDLSSDKAFSLSYGTSFGFCVGYCNKTLKVEQSTLLFTQMTNDKIRPPKVCKAVLTEQDKKELYSLIKVNNIKSFPETTGCPDCADGGAEWIAVTENGKTYRKTFEFGNAPKSVQDLVVKLRSTSEGFKDCK